MYGTTIRSYNENKNTKNFKKDIQRTSSIEAKKEPLKLKKNQDTKYMKLNNGSRENYEERSYANEGFSIKDLPIASVVITLILTMMLLVMTSGFGGL